jgi:hypothetical protein
MRFLFSFIAVAFAWAMVTENAAAAPRYPWWWTRFGRLTHAHILAVQAAEAAAAAAAAAQQTTNSSGEGDVTITGVSSGTLSLVSANTTVLANTATTVLANATTAVLVNQTVSGPIDLSQDPVFRVSGGTLTISGLDVSYTGADSTFSFNNAPIVESISGTHATQLNSSGTFSGTLVQDGNPSSFHLSGATGALTTDSFAGGTYTGNATLSISSMSAATLTLADGTVFNLGSDFAAAPSSGN